MYSVTPIESLNFFEKNIPDFLNNKPEIKSLINNLKTTLENEGSEFYHSNLLEQGKKFIQFVISDSITYLSSESNSPKDKSIKNINDYIDAYTKFEEMIFGLNLNYRDHTLHSLWVYLFGHQWIKLSGGYDKIQIAGQININYYKDGETYFVLATNTIKGNLHHLEAMWSMIALLHDLGYPIESLSSNPNVIFGKILEPFAIDFSSIMQIDLGSRINLLHQNICNLLSSMYRPVGLSQQETDQFYNEAGAQKSSGNILPMVKIRGAKIEKDEALEMEYKIGFINKNHSAWSATLAFKNISYLHESDIRAGGNTDYLKLLSRRDILYSIVHHTFEEPKDGAVNRFQFILLLIDDIEEALRFGKGGKLRGIKYNYCDVKWNIDTTNTIIELDYSDHEFDAEKKYEELSKKYRSQIEMDGNSNYKIIIKMKDKNFNKELVLNMIYD